MTTSIGNIKLVKALQDSIDRKSSHHKHIWLDLIKQYKLERDVRLFSWFAYDDRFKPNILSFQGLKERWGLKNEGFLYVFTVERLFYKGTTKLKNLKWSA